MTRIATDQDVVTLINVFTVTPENQQRLIDVLVEATNTVIRQMPGYVSANIHRSLDGRKVANYAQWRRKENLEVMLGNADAQEHIRRAAELAERFEPHLYEVTFTDGGEVIYDREPAETKRPGL